MVEDYKIDEEARKKQSELDVNLLYAETNDRALSLLNQGANPNSTARGDNRPLLEARNYKRAELLLSFGADVNHVQVNGENFISRFASREEKHGENYTPSIIRLAVEHNVDKNILNSALNQVYTVEAFETLINAGADINKFNWNDAVNKYNMYSGKYTMSVKDHEIDISNSHNASQMRKMMKMAINKGYDFEKGEAIYDFNKSTVEDVKKETKRENEDTIYEVRRKTEFSEMKDLYESQLTEDNCKFVIYAKSNNVRAMRNYLSANHDVPECVIKYLELVSPGNKFMNYYNNVMKDKEISFRANEEDYITNTIGEFAYSKSNPYAKAEEILSQNQDKKMNSRFFNAAYKQAEKNDPQALAFLIHIYQNSDETDKEAYFKHLLKIRTQGNNSERNDKANTIKNAISKSEQKIDDQKLETLSKVSYSPFSDLNKLIKKQNKTQR